MTSRSIFQLIITFGFFAIFYFSYIIFVAIAEGESVFKKHEPFAFDGYITTHEAEALADLVVGITPNKLKSGKTFYIDTTINPAFNFVLDNKNPFTDTYISSSDKIALYNIMSDFESVAIKSDLSRLIDNYIGYDGRLLAYADVLEKTSKGNTIKLNVAKSLRKTANKIKNQARTNINLPIDEAYEVEKARQQLEIQGNKPDE